MQPDPTITKMRFDLLAEEIKVLCSMENWATTLFLTAIGLATKQLVDWSNPATPSAPTQPLPLHDAAFLLPAGIGLLGFAFLRILNYRIRRVRRHQYELVTTQRQRNGSLGLVGWAMAAMPMFFGVACSAYFQLARPSLFGPLAWIFAVDCFAILVAIIFFSSQSRRESDGR